MVTNSKEYMNKYMKQWRSIPENKIKHNKMKNKYYLKTRERWIKYANEYLKMHPGKNRENNYNWRENNKEKWRQIQRKYMQSTKGKLAVAKCITSRKRNYTFNILFENIIDESTDWHHINDCDVVAIPKDLHMLYGGRYKTSHRENLMPIVEQLYNKSC